MFDVAHSLAPARRLVRRFTASLLAVALFIATGGATLAGQSCAHHDGAAAGAASHDVHAAAGAHASHDAPAEHRSHAGHSSDATGPSDAAHGAHAAGQNESGHAHDESGACTCVGACQSATTVPAPPAPTVVLAGALPSEVAAPELRLELLPRAWQAAWFLPPANGPPSLA